MPLDLAVGGDCRRRPHRETDDSAPMRIQNAVSLQQFMNTTSPDALEQMKDTPPDIMLVDIEMPREALSARLAG